jgi:hypothetical protein
MMKMMMMMIRSMRSYSSREISLELLFNYRSEEETSGDEAEDHDTDEDEDKSLDSNKAAQIQKL